MTSGRNVSFAVGRSIFASVANTFALFVQKAGIALTAAAGKIRIEAQNDGIQVVGKRDVEISSSDGWINLAAVKGIRLNGGGTLLEISPQGLLGFTNAQFLVHAGSHMTDVPLDKPVKMPLTNVDDAKVAEPFVLIDPVSGLGIPEQPYRITLEDGQVITGRTNDKGSMALVLAESMQPATVEILHNDGTDNPSSILTAMLTQSNDARMPDVMTLKKSVKTRLNNRELESQDNGTSNTGHSIYFAVCQSYNWGMRYTPSLKSPPGEQGTFFPNYWSLYLNVTHFEPMFRIKSPAPASDTGSRDEQLTPLRIFADTLYHEARHCQQWFWIFAFVQQHADNFETTPNISKWPTDLVTNIANAVDLASAIVRLAENQSIPAEPTTLISLKRMAIGQYVYSLNSFRRSGTCPKFLPDAAALEDEYKRARASAIDLLQHVGIGGTAIDVDAMVAEPNRCYRDYTARPWENDAFVCGEMAAAYWRDDLGLGITTYAPEQCSRAYEHADENKKVADRLAALSAGGSGSTGSARGN
ncbi:DUF2345 domain-containing protein [Caballeronia sp. CLC5]|uniref:DUF2345 domain-containing protein n=1 Tax=Caballeronia sp. CLC5 TaxID=2906764 RepID=UPI001F15E4DA|nr:DUF2345 domain-containing protein [Caballeronia sp. CLC5]MCE4574329.1 DUF2345 domain-containing protein [Caballeronia sp. CLC5]